MAQYEKLTGKAEQVNEDLLAARTDLDKKRAQLSKATADLKDAKAAMAQAATAEEAFRGKVDVLTSASFQGARFNKVSALLTGSSADDFLERAAALGVLASDNEEALSKLTGAVNMAADAQAKAAAAQKSAKDATTAAKQLLAKVTKSRNALDAQIEKVETAYNNLSGSDQASLAGDVDNSVYLGPPGAGGTAAEVAMQQRGKTYIYGAEGPNEFDCSGLTMFAYRAAGIELPHSSRVQFTMGKSVSEGEFQAGDLLFYGTSADTIHHVAMYIGDGMLVHASTSGVPVKTDDAPYGAGSDYLGAKRIAG
ncbi:MAG: NlpC/P60 family protein [Actinophytocola sp.]|uniref:C40 family peptidase n=1 Tax=Actinophytocola sp. TaxID=1872138 RepID=UPI003D6A5B2F